MSTLYVTQQDTVVRKTDERLKVTQKTETLLDVPMLKVSQVVVFGRVTVTAPTLQALLEHHIPVCYLSAHGRYVGRIEPALSKNALLRSAQYRAAFNATSTLALARQMVRGKLTNMRVLLQRANRDTDDPAVMQAVDQLKERLAAVAEVKKPRPAPWSGGRRISALFWCVRQPAQTVGHALREARPASTDRSGECAPELRLCPAGQRYPQRGEYGRL